MFIFKRCNCKTKRTISINTLQLNKLSKHLGLLSVKSRLKILFILNSRPHCVCDLMVHTKISQSLMSHHLADLTKTGFIESKRQGKYIDYCLTNKGKKSLKALELLVDN